MKRPPISAFDQIARERIKKWRLASAFTQAQLGEAVGRSPVWISRYEHAYFNADFDTLARMALALGHTLLDALDLGDKHMDQREREVVEIYRTIRQPHQPFALDVFRTVAKGLRNAAKKKR